MNKQEIEAEIRRLELKTAETERKIAETEKRIAEFKKAMREIELILPAHETQAIRDEMAAKRKH